MNSRFRRQIGTRRYKRMFVVVAEGTVSEREYFQLLNQETIVHVKCLRNQHNLPPKEALKRVREFVVAEDLRKTDEVWAVVDRDSWPEEHLTELHKWAQSKRNYGLALSNPKFEYWLLLHFDKGDQITTSTDCDSRLEKHLPQYNKHISEQHFTVERIKTAVDRAKKRDFPQCPDWPRNTGTTVYRLVEKILQELK